MENDGFSKLEEAANFLKKVEKFKLTGKLNELREEYPKLPELVRKSIEDILDSPYVSRIPELPVDKKKIVEKAIDLAGNYEIREVVSDNYAKALYTN